jgi:hypothetical protein
MVPTLLLRNCIERFAELKPHLSDICHFKIEFVLLNGELGE